MTTRPDFPRCGTSQMDPNAIPWLSPLDLQLHQDGHLLCGCCRGEESAQAMGKREGGTTAVMGEVSLICPKSGGIFSSH